MRLRELAEKQKEWSEKTFGPGPRTLGILRHIEKEIKEIEEDPDDVIEWADLIILAMEGATRRGILPSALEGAVILKQEANRARQWPPIGSIPEDKAIEHIR